MNELALFAGGGGGILGGKLLGWNTVCAVEIERYPREVLLHQQRLGNLQRFPIWDDVCTFDGRPWRGLVDVVSGGFPCQDISAAGKGAGIEGERSGLWAEMFRIICEVRPRYAFMENSPMLTSRGLGRVLGDLAEAGYDAAWMVLGAADVGAPHRRERIWILALDANADCVQCAEQGGEYARAEGSAGCGADGVEPGGAVEDAASDRLEAHWLFSGGSGEETKTRLTALAGGAGEDAAHAHRTRCAQTPPQRPDCQARRAEPCGGGHVPDSDLSGCEEQWRGEPDGEEHETAECGGWWGFEPNVGRVADGVAARVDRLRALGNGQVPLVAACAFKELERVLLSYDER